MSESRAVSRIVLDPGAGVTVFAVVEWLRAHGIDRVAAIGAGDSARVLWQESYRSPVQLTVPGDVLRAVDLGGTSGALTVINSGPMLPGEEVPAS